MGILDLLTVFDWISPIVGTVQDVTCNEPTVSFCVQRRDIGYVNHLIRPISSDIAFGSGEAIVTVKQSELGNAQYLLDRNKIKHW